jgi:nitronate monooxygenase
MLLTPRIVESVDLPVVTVGGIADGRTMAAALALGAEGVMMASRFIATRECVCHDDIKRELVRRQENDTMLFGQSIGLQGRALMNKVIREVIEVEERGGGLDELIPLTSGERIKEAWETGNVEMAPLMVGQSIGLIKDVPTCRELLERMSRECAETLERSGRMAGVGR